MRRLKILTRFLAACSWAIWILVIAQFWSNHKIWRMINDSDMTSTEGVVDRSYRFKTLSAHYAYHYLDTIPASHNVRYFSSPDIYLDYHAQPLTLGSSGEDSPLLFMMNPSLPLDVIATNKDFFLSEISSLIFIVILFLILRWLIAMFRRMEKGEFFTRKQYQLVRMIGFMVLLIPISEEVFRRIIMSVVKQNSLADFSLGGLYTIPKFDFPIFFVGSAIIIIAEAFKYGLDLQHDQNLTI